MRTLFDARFAHPGSRHQTTKTASHDQHVDFVINGRARSNLAIGIGQHLAEILAHIAVAARRAIGRAALTFDSIAFAQRAGIDGWLHGGLVGGHQFRFPLVELKRRPQAASFPREVF